MPCLTASRALRPLTWTAAGLSAAASMLHWIGIENHSHEWAIDSAFIFVAAAAQMLLAVMLVFAPWHDRWEADLGRHGGVRTARVVYLAGAAGNAVIVLYFVAVAFILAQTTEMHHVNHGALEAEAIRIVDAISAAVEVALIGVLLWMYRLAGQLSSGAH